MYRTLANSKFFRRLSHCCLCLNNVICNLHCPLFDIIFQDKPPKTLFLQCMQRTASICGIRMIQNIFHSRSQEMVTTIYKIMVHLLLKVSFLLFIQFISSIFFKHPFHQNINCFFCISAFFFME